MEKRRLVNIIEDKKKNLLSINLLLSEFHKINNPQNEINESKLHSSHYNTNDFDTCNFDKYISKPIKDFNKINENL